MSSFQQQQHKAKKEKYGPFKGKRNQQNSSWKRSDGRSPDKDFNTTILNMPKEIRCGKSQENDV